MARRYINPDNVHPPFGHYHHGVVVDAPARILVTSGQLGISKDGAIPESCYEQARICLQTITATLREAGMSVNDIVRLSAFVTCREDFTEYMRARDEFVVAPAPASTLIIVSGFTRPEFKVEVEATAISVV